MERANVTTPGLHDATQAITGTVGWSQAVNTTTASITSTGESHLNSTIPASLPATSQTSDMVSTQGNLTTSPYVTLYSNVSSSTSLVQATMTTDRHQTTPLAGNYTTLSDATTNASTFDISTVAGPYFRNYTNAYSTTSFLNTSSLTTLDSWTINSTCNISTWNTSEIYNSSIVWVNVTEEPPPEGYGIAESIVIWFVVSLLIILTAGGNLMVMISFKMDKQLQTVSNYFLLSLAVADFAIGILSMPLYTMYLLLGYWPLGPIVCDIWLSWDYVMSNASVANLIIISLDRYLSVTRPLTYRAKRTPKRAAIMITCAWIISAMMWTPWIFAWPHIEGQRTVKEGKCYIQFLATNEYLTIATALAAFYIPVLILCILYYKIYRETKKRNKGLEKLQAGRPLKFRSNTFSETSDDDANLGMRRSDSSPDMEGSHNHHTSGTRDAPLTCWQKFKMCCRVDRDADYMEESTGSDTPASPLYELTPSSSSTRQSTLRRDASLPGHYQQNGKGLAGKRNNSNPLMIPLISVSNRPSPATPSTEVTSGFSRSTTMSSPPIDLRRKPAVLQEMKGSISRDSDKSDSDTYTIVLKLPEESCDESGAKTGNRAISESDEDAALLPGRSRVATVCGSELAKQVQESHDPVGDVIEALEMQQCDFSEEPSPPGRRRRPHTSDHIRPPYMGRSTQAQKFANKVRTQRTRKRRVEKRQDTKAAKTLSAILLAFVITWTPYNIFTLIAPFCNSCIGKRLYAFGYWLCYINSTVNPMCYALCNANFRRTYWRILTCRWVSGRRRRAAARSTYYESSVYINR